MQQYDLNYRLVLEFADAELAPPHQRRLDALQSARSQRRGSATLDASLTADLLDALETVEHIFNRARACDPTRPRKRRNS